MSNVTFQISKPIFTGNENENEMKFKCHFLQDDIMLLVVCSGALSK